MTLKGKEVEVELLTYVLVGALTNVMRPTELL